MNYKSEIDVAVLIIFFNRPKQFEQVFEQVKQARPTKLFLYQDGPREDNQMDLEGIDQCRRIADQIDWECEVHKWYQTENIGCDPSEFIAQKWLFDHVEKGIILEDDDVPSQSFFPFCKELLDRYEHNPRVYQISGMNQLERMEQLEYSYFFSRRGTICGWATWRRVAQLWDDNYSFLDDEEALENLAKHFEKKSIYKHFIKTCKMHKETGKAYYESINYYAKMSRGMLDIIPKCNLVSNIGLTAGATHTNVELNNLPKGIRKVYFMKTYEMEFPLKHPRKIQENIYYLKRINRIMAWGHPLVILYRINEMRVYKFIHAKSGERKQLILKKLKEYANKIRLTK